jgi:uncharacterized membrane-anchored protein YhcB (DUF1043 family)
MTTETAWLLAILAVIIAGGIGYFVGRRSATDRKRIEELESEIRRKQDQSDDYRKEVATHFDKTATLFVSMAGSYKELFEHLSTGYEKLSAGSAREILHQRVDALLVGNSHEAIDDVLLTDEGPEAMPAQTEAPAETEHAPEAAADPRTDEPSTDEQATEEQALADGPPAGETVGDHLPPRNNSR